MNLCTGTCTCTCIILYMYIHDCTSTVYITVCVGPVSSCVTCLSLISLVYTCMYFLVYNIYRCSWYALSPKTWVSPYITALLCTCVHVHVTYNHACELVSCILYYISQDATSWHANAPTLKTSLSECRTCEMPTFLASVTLNVFSLHAHTHTHSFLSPLPALQLHFQMSPDLPSLPTRASPAPRQLPLLLPLCPICLQEWWPKYRLWELAVN